MLEDIISKFSKPEQAAAISKDGAGRTVMNRAIDGDLEAVGYGE
jgi:hypothetical protein